MTPFTLPIRDDRDAAEALLTTVAALHGLDLTVWDAWLAQLPDCGAKAELIARRDRAKHARSSDAMLRHLEWMQRRRFEIEREAFVLPRARTGNKVRAPYAKRNAERARVAQAQHAAWQRQADALWAQPQHADKSKSAIARLIDPARENTVRHFIRRSKK